MARPDVGPGGVFSATSHCVYSLGYQTWWDNVIVEIKALTSADLCRCYSRGTGLVSAACDSYWFHNSCHVSTMCLCALLALSHTQHGRRSFYWLGIKYEEKSVKNKNILGETNFSRYSEGFNNWQAGNGSQCSFVVQELSLFVQSQSLLGRATRKVKDANNNLYIS